MPLSPLVLLLNWNSSECIDLVKGSKQERYNIHQFQVECFIKLHQVSELQNEGRECILITSGAVAFGKQKLAQEVMMSMSMRETIQQNNTKEEIAALMTKSLKKPNAAVGQSGLQALYETMFRNYGILVGQVQISTVCMHALSS